MPVRGGTDYAGGVETRGIPSAQAEVESAPVGTVEAQTVNGAASQKNTGHVDHPTLVNQLQNAIPQIQDMQPVANVTGAEIPAGNSIIDRLTSFVSSFGGKVTRNGFGDVIFSRTRIKNGVLGHGTGQAKFETFAAVPAVIKYGTQIGYIENYAGRNYDTYVFAAPINYKNNTSYLGVIVTKDARDGRYYVHEVIDSEGGLIYANNNASGATIPDRPNVVPGRADTVAAPDGSRNDMGGGSASDTSYPASAPATGSNVTQGAEGVKGDLPQGRSTAFKVLQTRYLGRPED